MYGLTVEGEAEYFANGILVSNCDAFLYLVRSLLPSYRPYVTEEPMTHAEFVMKQQTDARRDALRQVRKELKRKMKHGSVIADIAMGN